MRILGSLAMLLLAAPLAAAPLAAAPLAAATPAPQAPSRATIINQKSPGSEGGVAGGGGCNIARCPNFCEFYYGPMGGMSMCYGSPKSCDWIDTTTNKPHCTCEFGHPMPVNY